MNLDAAILNSLKATPMENAMGGVMKDMGQNYTLQAVPQSAKTTGQIKGKPITTMNANPISRPSIGNDTVKLNATQGSNKLIKVNGKPISPLLRRTF